MPSELAQRGSERVPQKKPECSVLFSRPLQLLACAHTRRPSPIRPLRFFFMQSLAEGNRSFAFVDIA